MPHTRIAMRTDTAEPKWILIDHLGSTSVVANYNGTSPAVQLYRAWGEKRYPTGPFTLPTTYRYTGQRQDVSLGGADGLYYYGARWYDASLGRFAQADTIVPSPGNPLAWDRYSYALNNPLRFNDPTGHMVDDGCDTEGCTGHSNATVHTIFMGGMKPYPKPNSPNYAKRAEDTYDPEGRYYPWAVLDIGYDVIEQVYISVAKSSQTKIDAYLNYVENSDGSMSVTSVDIWNNSNLDVSLAAVEISATPNSCDTVCISGPSYDYLASPRGIGSPSAGVGVVIANSRRTVSLTPSGSMNPSNSFVHNYSVDVFAVFTQFLGSSSDYAPLMTMLSSRIIW